MRTGTCNGSRELKGTSVGRQSVVISIFAAVQFPCFVCVCVYTHTHARARTHTHTHTYIYIYKGLLSFVGLLDAHVFPARVRDTEQRLLLIGLPAMMAVSSLEFG